MTPLRAVVLALVGLLVLAPLLGFAAGDAGLHVWDKHSRHAESGHDHRASPVVWKTTPGTTPMSGPPVILPLLGWLGAGEPMARVPVVSNPPFVPPRG